MLSLKSSLRRGTLFPTTNYKNMKSTGETSKGFSRNMDTCFASDSVLDGSPLGSGVTAHLIFMKTIGRFL